MCKTAATITVTKGLPSSDRVHRLSPPTVLLSSMVLDSGEEEWVLDRPSALFPRTLRQNF